MKKTCLPLALLLAAAAGMAQGEEISSADLQQEINGNIYINLFDIRDADAFSHGALPGAMSLPLDELREQLQTALDNGFSNMALPLYVYGETEEESLQAAQIMKDLGFTNVHYLPSMAAWEGEIVRPGQLLGSLQTVDIYGRQVDASLIAGKKLIMVNVWATYCNPCIGEMGDLGKLAREMEAEGVMILGLVSDCSNEDLSADEKQTEQARAIAENTGAAYPHLLPSLEMYRNVIAQIQAVPTTFFLNGEGEMVGQAYVGARDYSDWKEIIQEQLNGL